MENTRKAKIVTAFSSPIYRPQFGEARMLFNISELLLRRGHDVRVLSIGDRAYEIAGENGYHETVIRRTPDIITHADGKKVRGYRASMESLVERFIAQRGALNSEPEMINRLNEEKPEIILTSNFYMPHVVDILDTIVKYKMDTFNSSGRAPKLIILTADYRAVSDFFETEKERFISRMGAVENGDLASVNLDFSNSVKSIYSEMIAYADAVVFYTDQDLEFAKGRYPARVREKLLRIQPALDIGVEKAKTREKLEKAIFVGTPRHLRNAVTIEMIKNVIAPRVPGVVFIIAGPDLAECRQGNVVCLDFRDDTRQLIKDSDVYVAPVMSGAGISTKFLDPISLGIPIITTPKGAEGYPAVHMKDMIIEPDPAGFPYWINELNSKESRARLAANASTGMEAYFSPEAVGRKWDELISKLLDMR